MSKITLSQNTSTPRLTDGVHVFKITSANYQSDFGKLSIVMETYEGAKHYENFSFLKNDGTQNEGALTAFSSLCRAIFGNVDEIETADLVGKFVKCEIGHESYESKDGTTKSKSVKVKGTYWETPTAGETSLWTGPDGTEEIDLGSALDDKLDLDSLLDD